MNPQVPGHPTSAPPVWGAGMPAGSANLAPPNQAPPAAAQPPPPMPRMHRRRRPAWPAVWAMLALSLLLAISAVAMSITKLTDSTPAATTTTVMAPPPPKPTFSPDQITAAKKEACDASNTAAATISNSQKNFAAASRDRLSPDYRPALANFQLVVALETQYMEQHLPPATPKEIADATNDYINALVALADANTRELSNHDADVFVGAVAKTGSRLDKVCE